ncbi:MAG: DNA-3-methyladenine glycosylase [Terracidiphilus sp.]|jgi:DNA-3-methyladenine glycosylase
MNSNRPPGRLLTRAFFDLPPERVAPLLLGKILVRRTEKGELLAGRIVEVEAYLGPHDKTPDPAAHSYRGETARNSVLFGPPGHAYVYFIYGSYYCMNFSCEGPGRGGGILLRALEPVTGIEQMARNRGLKIGAAPCELTSGPGRLCQALSITRAACNGLDLLDPASPLQVRDDGFRLKQVLVTRRIGISHAADLPLRFAVPANACVSGPKSLTGKCIFLRVKSVHGTKPLQSQDRTKAPGKDSRT